MKERLIRVKYNLASFVYRDPNAKEITNLNLYLLVGPVQVLFYAQLKGCTILFMTNSST